MKDGVLGQSRRRLAGWLVSKGRQVYIEGRLTTREYETKDGRSSYAKQLDGGASFTKRTKSQSFFSRFSRNATQAPILRNSVVGQFEADSSLRFQFSQ
jgi:single-stranded DNA-binding protein